MLRMRIIESRNPFAPSEIIETFPSTSPDDVAKAVSAARVAQSEWEKNAFSRAAALSKCAAVFREHQDEIISLIVREVAKPIAEARGEFARSVAILDYYAQAALDSDGETFPNAINGYLLSIRKPHGVVGIITPWNFPFAIPLWKAAPALAVGNAVIVKPSEFATASAVYLEGLLSQALPAHIFTVLPGFAETGAAIIDSVDALSFTGSAAVGKIVMRAAIENSLPVQAEMGGQNPAIILPDADLTLLAGHLTLGAMSYSGQKCTATRRVLIVGDSKRYNEVRDVLVEAVSLLKSGDPAAEDTYIGPLINAAAQENYRQAIAAVEKSGRILVGGDTPKGEGWNVQATLSEGLPPGHKLLLEETFAPLAHLVSLSTISEAIETANSVRFGLTASIHTQDLEAAHRLANALNTGMVKVNAPTAGVDFHAPFGGSKDSSYGLREQGKAALNFYSYTRTIAISSGKRNID